MRLKQLVIFSLLALLVRSAKDTNTDYTCAHDGVSVDSKACQCTSTSYKGSEFAFYSGKSCAQIECTNSGVRVADEFDESNERCSCPPGFLGAHCEPTHCVPGEVRSFEQASHARDVAVIITYNDKFQEQVLNKDKNPNLPKTICDSIKSQDGVDVDSKIHIYLMQTDFPTNAKDCEQDVKISVEMSCDEKTNNGKTTYSCEGVLTADYINDALKTMGEDSRLIILANEGIKCPPDPNDPKVDLDCDIESRIEEIRKKAISLRTQIHAIVLSPRQPNENTVYFKDDYKLLRDLCESTLGFFITPFDASGGQILGVNGTDGMTVILNEMMGVFFDYVVVDRITTNKTSCESLTDFTVFRTREEDPDWKFWITVTSNGGNYDSYTTNWAPILPTMENTIDSGFFKAYTLPAVKDQIYAMYPFNKMGTKCVPTTILVLAKSAHLARFAITNDDAIDASSPYAIAEADNTLVGHFVDYYHEDHLKSLYLEFSNNNFNADLDKEPYTRPCQYNAKFSDVSCVEGTNTLIRVRDKESGAAVTVQSLYCTEPEKKASLRSQNGFVSFADEPSTDVPNCSPPIEVKQDKRTLILAAHATDAIYQLFNGNSKSAIKYLNDLDDTGHYSNYVVNIFNAQDGTDAESFTTYGEFKAKLMERWNVDYQEFDPPCTAIVNDKDGHKKSEMDVLLPLTEIVSPGATTNPNSDIIYIVDRAIINPDPTDIDGFNNELKFLQKKMYEKRLRLIVLLLGCESYDFSLSTSLKDWNTAATKTGGFMVHFSQPEDLNKFLASYVDWVKGETASSIDGKDASGMPFSFDPIKSTPFQVQQGKSYTFLVNTIPDVDSVDVSTGNGVETITRTKDLLGNSLSLYDYVAKEDGVLTLQVTPPQYFSYSSIRVLELPQTSDDDTEQQDFATIGFTEASCIDKFYPDLNPQQLQFPVTSTVEGAKVSITIFASDGSVLRSGTACDDDAVDKKCDPASRAATSYPLDYNWKCNDQDNVYYISTDVITETSTFTRVITTQCFGTGNDCDQCINGECIVESGNYKSCKCWQGFSGNQCDQPVCLNGGTVTASLECACTDDYEGQFCQKYKKCDSVPQVIPQFKSIATTIIFLVEKSNFVTERIKELQNENMFQSARAAQYLIVEYGPDGNYTIGISTTDKDLLYGILSKIESAESATPELEDPVQFDAIPAIQAALQAQTTDSAHLFWFVQDDSLEEDFVSEVFEPIATNRVTISAFFGKRVPEDDQSTVPLYPVHPVTLTGGTVFLSNGKQDYIDLFNMYVLELIKYDQSFEHRPNTLSIVSSDKTSVIHNINIDKSVDKLFIIADVAAQNIVVKKDDRAFHGAEIPGGIAFGDYPEADALGAGTYTINITYNGELNRTSSVIATTWNQVAYGFYRRDESDDFMDTAMMGNNVLVTYWLSEGTQYERTAVITPLSIDGAGESVKVFMTEREECAFTLSVPFNCTGDADAYGVKITNSIIAKGDKTEWKVDKYIPVICIKSHECHNGGTATDDGCDCSYFYDGLYCEIDKCTNGDKVDGNKCVCNTGYSGEFCDEFTKPADRPGSAYLFIQDVCGTAENLMDDAQSVLANYMDLLKTTYKFYLGTNEPGSSVVPITSTSELTKVMDANRAAAAPDCQATLGNVLDAYYDVLRKQSSSASFSAQAASDPSVGSAYVAHVTTVPVDKNKGNSLPRLEHDYDLSMEVIGITEKNDLFPNEKSFDEFPGEFTQTYDPEVALFDLVNYLGSEKKPSLPPANFPRCVENLQAAFTFHTDISSVTNMKDYRSKAQKVIQSVTNYFSVPIGNIDMDDDTCVFNTDQTNDKTLFYGSIYANESLIGIPTFCMSNMNSYPDTIVKADYKQANQVTLQKVVDSYAKWYSTEQKMQCHCFDYTNPNTTAIIMWTPLSPTSNDQGPVSLAGFDQIYSKYGGSFKHIVMPMGFKWGDSPLWQSLVPEDQWTDDASMASADDIIQQIWTITCRLAGHIDAGQTAEPYNPYTLKPKSNQFDGGDPVTDDPNPLPR